MFTTCPHCHTTFKITAEQLRIAAGKARCGQCNKVFSALYSLTDDLQLASQASNQTDNNLENNHTELLSLKGKSYSKSSRHTEVIHKDPTNEINLDDYFESTTSSSNPKTAFAWLFLISLSVLFLIAQHIHFNSHDYSLNPIYRPLVKNLCAISQCDIALPQKPNLIEVVDGTQVVPNSHLKDILDIKLSFRNKAEFIQSYPKLKIIFSDTLGKLIAQRVFSPHEYLGDAKVDAHQLEQGLLPKQQSQVLLQIVDPSPEASLSFEVHFL